MNGNTKSALQPELTPRQRQILKLLQEGKVNKEVARELDIGVGTVKQHIVALFKKLNVSNRAMAVSRGMSMHHEHENHGPAMKADGSLERRPCVVLSIALPENASQLAVRLMYGTLAELASADDAIFLTRQGNAGDIIFGIQRVTEYDVAIALKTASTAHADLLALDADMAKKMRGCLTAGLAIASMKRFGGWTGEAIASAVISSARELLDSTPTGQFAFDSEALDLIEAFGIGGSDTSHTLPFQELNNLHWTGSRRAYPLVGRDAELTILNTALNKAKNGNGELIHLEGEMGMGKSRLCEEIMQRCLDLEGRTSFYRSLPAILGKNLYDTTRGQDCTVEEVAASLNTKTTRTPELIIVDDFHLLPAEQQALLSAAGAAAAKSGKLVIFSGRRGGSGCDSWQKRGGIPMETIHLRRMSTQAIESLALEMLSKDGTKTGKSEINNISSAAAGVPLFAVELARHHDADRLALPLLVAVNARLDSLPLDRHLLRAVARNPANATVEKIAETLGENIESSRQQVERSVAAGVLSRSADGCLSFTHPLLHRAIDCLVIE